MPIVFSTGGGEMRFDTPLARYASAGVGLKDTIGIRYDGFQSLAVGKLCFYIVCKRVYICILPYHVFIPFGRFWAEFPYFIGYPIDVKYRRRRRRRRSRHNLLAVA